MSEKKKQIAKKKTKRPSLPEVEVETVYRWTCECGLTHELHKKPSPYSVLKCNDSGIYMGCGAKYYPENQGRP